MAPKTTKAKSTKPTTKKATVRLDPDAYEDFVTTGRCIRYSPTFLPLPDWSPVFWIARFPKSKAIGQLIESLPAALEGEYAIQTGATWCRFWTQTDADRASLAEHLGIEPIIEED